MSGAVSLRGRLKQARLEAALADVIGKVEILRTTFTMKDGAPVQTVHAPTPATVQRFASLNFVEELNEEPQKHVARRHRAHHSPPLSGTCADLASAASTWRRVR